MTRSTVDIESYITQLDQELEDVASRTGIDDTFYQAIVDTPFMDALTATQLDLGIVVLLLVNKKKKTIDRIALSDTEQAKGAVRMSAKPFHEIKIPAGYEKNIIAKAIIEHEPKHTEHWENMFTPALTRQEARFNQAGAGIECSWVYPLNTPGGGALIFSYYQPQVNLTDRHRQFMAAYTNRVSWCLNKKLEK